MKLVYLVKRGLLVYQSFISINEYKLSLDVLSPVNYVNTLFRISWGVTIPNAES